MLIVLVLVGGVEDGEINDTFNIINSSIVFFFEEEIPKKKTQMN